MTGYRVHVDEDEIYTIEPISWNVAYPDPPKYTFDTLPKTTRNRIALLKAADIGTRIDGVGVKVTQNEFHLDD